MASASVLGVSWNARWMYVTAVVALLLACASALSAPRASAEERADSELAAASIGSQELVGLRAPACELTRLSFSAADVVVDADDVEVEDAAFVESFQGRVVLVDFWASWCPTCEHAFGFLNELARDFRDAGLEVVAINLDSDPRDARDFLAGQLAGQFSGRRIEFELARDATGRCPRGFGLVGMPSAYLIDAAGRVRAVTRGFRPGEARALRARIAALLTNSPNALPAVAAGSAVEEAVEESVAKSASEQRAPDSTPSSAR